MARHELEIGALVHITGLEVGHAVPEASYRIEQLLQIDGGATLYKIRCDAEPFDRVVAAPVLTRVTVSRS